MQLGVLAYPGCFASEVFGVPDVLTMASHVAAAHGEATDHPTGHSSDHEVTVVSPRRRVQAAGGFGIEVRALRELDVLVVPGFQVPRRDRLDEIAGELSHELAAIRSYASSGTTVVSICVGAFLLAAAGLLDGREATTAWRYADELARRHPDVTVRADRLVVTDRGVTTTAAFSAMYDFALTLIRSLDGPTVARRTARVALLDDARSVQTPYADPDLLPGIGLEFSTDVKRFLDRRLDARYDLPELARTFHVSTRTMLRRFGREAGHTPLRYLQAARVQRARHLLETTDRTVAEIAADVGYTDTGAFGAVFARHVGRRPREYRTTFRR